MQTQANSQPQAAQPLLQIRGLRAEIDGKLVLAGVDLDIAAGEVAAIMGPNGSGKSTLAQVLAGRDIYHVTGGSVRYAGMDLLAMPAEERARAGLFLAFQYPVEIPGVSNVYLLKAALNAQRKHQGLPELDAMEFLQKVKALTRELGMDEKFLQRGVNEGFSGGEKKRNEMLQMALLQPRLAILDETDSGLDVDALKAVAQGVNAMRAAERAFVLITHYERLLEHIVPDRVHVLWQGRIVTSGGPELARRIEREGYAWLQQGAAAPSAQEA
ncbi:putative ATP-dependent transporter SufC [mine drainage metagenome]|uniref:Putative ATP-dependent transporter SufC n=1 Tax=mine drainage metagenome TaxID=410659 RepID=A0A1J5RXX5_9ZZZZ